MAKFLKEKNINGKIIAIDTFLGSPEHMEQYTDELGLCDHGHPQLYKQFLANVQQNNVSDYVYPFAISFVQGGHYLETKDLKADIIYIDAGHEYESVLLDIQVYWRRLKHGGAMIFDDWKWVGVNKAIREFLDTHKLEIKSFNATNNNAMIIKSKLL